MSDKGWITGQRDRQAACCRQTGERTDRYFKKTRETDGGRKGGDRHIESEERQITGQRDRQVRG